MGTMKSSYVHLLLEYRFSHATTNRENCGKSEWTFMQANFFERPNPDIFSFRCRGEVRFWTLKKIDCTFRKTYFLETDNRARRWNKAQTKQKKKKKNPKIICFIWIFFPDCFCPQEMRAKRSEWERNCRVCCELNLQWQKKKGFPHFLSTGPAWKLRNNVLWIMHSEEMNFFHSNITVIFARSIEKYKKRIYLNAKYKSIVCFLLENFLIDSSQIRGMK